MDKIAVLIPCYNEDQTIEKVVKDWKRALPKAVVYVYDNNSTDETARVAESAGAVVRHEYQQGKGNVIRRMFREIDAECYIMVDGDDTYPAEAGPALVKEVLEHSADMVIGDRLSSTYFEQNKRRFHNAGNVVTRLFINKIFGTNIKDVMTGLRAFSFNFVKTFPVLSQGFEIETEMTIHAIDKNMRIENIIIDYRDRPKGSTSKLKTFPDGFKVLKTIFNLFKNYRPLQFFGCVSIILFILALGFFAPVFYQYLVTGLVEKFPTLIVCAFVALAGMMSLFAGIVLQTIICKNRQQFEFNLQVVNAIYNANSVKPGKKL